MKKKTSVFQNMLFSLAALLQHFSPLAFPFRPQLMRVLEPSNMRSGFRFAESSPTVQLAEYASAEIVGLPSMTSMNFHFHSICRLLR